MTWTDRLTPLRSFLPVVHDFGEEDTAEAPVGIPVLPRRPTLARTPGARPFFGYGYRNEGQISKEAGQAGQTRDDEISEEDPVVGRKR